MLRTARSLAWEISPETMLGLMLGAYLVGSASDVLLRILLEKAVER